MKRKIKIQRDKFREQARSMTLSTILYQQRASSEMAAFYTLFSQKALAELRQLYKREITSVHSDLIFVNQRQMRVFKHATTKPNNRRKVVKVHKKMMFENKKRDN